VFYRLLLLARIDEYQKCFIYYKVDSEEEEDDEDYHKKSKKKRFKSDFIIDEAEVKRYIYCGARTWEGVKQRIRFPLMPMYFPFPCRLTHPLPACW
jgi:hypothetical protein